MCQALHAEFTRNRLEMETKSRSARVFEAALGLDARRSRVSRSGGSGWRVGSAGLGKVRGERSHQSLTAHLHSALITECINIITTVI